MPWGSLAAADWVSFTNIQGGSFTLKSGQSHVTSDDWMTKSDADNKYELNGNNPYMAAKSANDWVAKRDLSALPICGGTTFDYYYGDLVKLAANAGKASYSITGLGSGEVVNIVYNSNIIHVAVANGSGTATGSFYFPYDGSNRFVTFDSTSY